MQLYQWQLPDRIKGFPTPCILIIALLAAINAAVWTGAGIVLRYHPLLVTPAVLSYTLGLRHALDADHISAIDLMTRRLIAAGQNPVTVGTFFSLGHSTIVVVTCIAVAATSGALRARFDNFSYVGGIIGTSISAVVLLLLCAGNSWVMWRLVKSLQAALARQHDSTQRPPEGGDPDAGANPAENGRVAGQLDLEGAGLMARLFRRLFRIVDRPWKMYPIGVLFGMGFDTSSEVALLALASLQGSQGTSIWLILIFPILFTGTLPRERGLCGDVKWLTEVQAGMCLLDTTDGALMMALYTSKVFARDHISILYYSIALTGITILVAASIGLIQILCLVQGAVNPPGSFWEGVIVVSDNFHVIGGSICGVFLLFGIASVLFYGPWRRKMDRRGASRVTRAQARETTVGERLETTMDAV